MVFPDGVAIKVDAGQQILLNLHLFNVDDAAIEGTSGTEVLLVDGDTIDQLAEMVFGGTFFISLPPQQETVVSGGCTFSEDATVTMLWPHMHQHGIHSVVEHVYSGGSDVLVDHDYSFYEQVNYPLTTPLEVKAGESIDMECTYFNTSDETVTFGDGSKEEMYFIGMYRYPAQNSGLFCGGVF